MTDTDPQGLLSILAVVYIVVAERIVHQAYNIIAVIVLDALFVVFWLSTWAACAALRASFVFSINVDDCYNDGSTVNSNHCFTKRDIPILFRSGAAMLSAIAGLGALTW